MPDEPEAAGGIKETDIVFDCPHCGKSLAIDYRGAGLAIACSDCGNIVEVPIPVGMDIVDLDSSEEEQEVRILNLRRSLANAEGRVRQLEEELESVSNRRESLEQARAVALNQDAAVRANIEALRACIAEMARVADSMSAAIAQGSSAQ
jgi:transcription elongation factor Elf1